MKNRLSYCYYFIVLFSVFQSVFSEQNFPPPFPVPPGNLLLLQGGGQNPAQGGGGQNPPLFGQAPGPLAGQNGAGVPPATEFLNQTILPPRYIEHPTIGNSIYSFNPPQGDANHNVTDQVRALALYLHVLYENELYIAEAEFLDAKSRHETSLSLRLLSLLNGLRHELMSLKQTEVNMFNISKEFDKWGKYLSQLRMGHTSKEVFMAIDYFCIQLLRPREIKDIMTSRIRPCDKTCFVANEFVKNNKKVAIKNFAGKTLGDLITFLRVNNYSVKMTSDAYQDLLIFIKGIYKKSSLFVASIFNRYTKLRETINARWTNPNDN